MSRTASPFLNPGTNGSGPARPKSPLIESESIQEPTASRTTSSSAIRKTTTSGAPRKANVLGAKKTQKLGVKRVGGAEGLDFEAAEKKAKEEAERIAKLGYDPDAEAADILAAKSIDKNKIVSPTPIKPAQAGYGASNSKERSSSEAEKIGVGLARLGFGQTGGAKPAAAPAPKKLGFGSVGGSRATDDGMFIALCSLSSPRHSVDSQTTTNVTRGQNLALKKASLPMSFSTRVPTTRRCNRKPSRGCKDSRAHRQSPATHISVDPRTTFPRRTSMAITVIWKGRQGILCANSVSPRGMIWTISLPF